MSKSMPTATAASKSKLPTINLGQNRRGGGKRKKEFVEPTPVPAGEGECYGIIISYLGGHYCSVLVWDESRISEVRMKLCGKLQPRKAKQKIVLGSFVRVAFGTITLIYKDVRIVPFKVRDTLRKDYNTRTGGIHAEVDHDVVFQDLDPEEEACANVPAQVRSYDMPPSDSESESEDDAEGEQQVPDSE